jgi:hypothetical protein
LCQLAEKHRHELPPTAETSRMPLGLMLPHGSLEAVAGNQL